MCVFWRCVEGKAELYREDEHPEVMFGSLADYFKKFGRYWWANGGLSSQERNEVDNGGMVRVRNVIHPDGVLIYYQSGFCRVPYRPLDAELSVDILPWHSDLAYRAPERTLVSTESSQRPVPSLVSQ
jgi:hypothetical protein